MYSIIVAIANNNAIGKNNNLLVYLPNDLKWFKKNTLDKTVIMGRKTFESLPNGPLPKRKNIVLTRNTDYSAFSADNCFFVRTIEELDKILNISDENFIIGGAEIYKQFLPLSQKLYITKIYADFEADVFFPEINYEEWELIEKIENKADDKHKYDFDFLIFIRKKIGNKKNIE